MQLLWVVVIAASLTEADLVVVDRSSAIEGKVITTDSIDNVVVVKQLVNRKVAGRSSVAGAAVEDSSVGDTSFAATIRDIDPEGTALADSVG
jgi:hypothetical protein